MTCSGAARIPCVPLDAAARRGHLEVVRELIRGHGIEGCGGASGGVFALGTAAEAQRVEVMELLTSAGVVDTGRVLQDAATLGRESSVKVLLQQWKRIAGGEGAPPYTWRPATHLAERPWCVVFRLAASHALPEPRGCSWMRGRMLRRPFDYHMMRAP